MKILKQDLKPIEVSNRVLEATFSDGPRTRRTYRTSFPAELGEQSPNILKKNALPTV